MKKFKPPIKPGFPNFPQKIFYSHIEIANSTQSISIGELKELLKGVPDDFRVSITEYDYQYPGILEAIKETPNENYDKELEKFNKKFIKYQKDIEKYTQDLKQFKKNNVSNKTAKTKKANKAS